jgi:tripartite-type tricarboxylate transporter receptor subunit TctC
MKRHRSFTLQSLAALLVALLLGIVPAAWGADAYPSKPIKLLVPFAPGGIGDMTGRIVAEKLSETLGQRVVVDNRPSAGMTVAADLALKAPADGYTIFHAGNGAAISMSLFKSLNYDVLRDFTQLSTLATYDLVICVDAESRYTSLTQLIRIAKANPGKLNFGTISIGSTQHLAAELFKTIAGVDVVIVPYKSTPDLLVALRSGIVDAAFEWVPGILPQIEGKTIKMLATASPKRYVRLPDVPTTKEAGLPGFQVAGWNGYSLKKGTPKPIIDRLSKEITLALKSQDVIQKMHNIGAEPWPNTPEQTGKHMAAEIARWKGVIEKAKIPLR